MTNPKILERVAALYASGEIDDAKLDEYVEKGVITREEAERIKEGESNMAMREASSEAM